MNNFDKILNAIKKIYNEEEAADLIFTMTCYDEDQLFLNALRCAGVDNWEGYEDAVDMYNEWRVNE